MNARKRWVALLAAVVVLTGASAADAALVGYWQFDGDVLDSSGSGYHGTPINGPTYTTGKSGQAIELNGSNQYVTTTSATNLGLNGSFTASAWVRPDATNGDRTIYGTIQTGSNVGLHLVIRNDKAHMGFYGNDMGGVRTINTGEWQHVTWHYDAGTQTQTIAVNGQYDNSGGGHIPFAGTDVVNFSRWGGSNYFDGLIDEATIYDTALAPNQVIHLANGGDPQALPTANPNSFFLGTPTGPVLLGPNLADGTRNAYQLVTRGGGGLTWDQARVDAMNHSYMGVQGHLVTMDSANENLYANGFGSGDRWMGIHDNGATSAIDGTTLGGSEGNFVWVNGQPVTYTNWNGGEPNNSGGEDAGILSGGGGWNDHNAGQTTDPDQSDHRLGSYVIEYEIGAPGTTGGPRIMPKTVILPDGTKHAYERVTDAVGWTAAKLDAESRTYEGATGHLVTLGSQAEQTLAEGIGAGWIGLTDLAGWAPGAFEGGNQNGWPLPAPGTPPVAGEKGYGWAWVTGESLVYQNWNNPGEPNGNTAENFAEMVGGGLWNDLSTQTRPYTVEYDLGAAQPAFHARMIKLNPANTAVDNDLNRAGEALSVMTGYGAGSRYDVTTDVTHTPFQVDYAGSTAGNFSADNPWPDGTAGDGGDDFAVRATSRVYIPEGEWTIAFSSDDGGYVHLDGVQFSSDVNTNGDRKINDGTIVYDTAGSHVGTLGHFTVPQGGMTTTLDAMFFERGGGDYFEISIAPGYWPSLNTEAFALLLDGQYGWSATPVAPRDGFGVRMIQLDPSNPLGFNNEISDAAEAIGLAQGVTGTGDFVIGGQAYRVSSFTETTAPYVDFGIDANSGDFNEPTLHYPDGRADPGDDFLVGAQAFMRVPAGTYTIAFASDDGGVLQLTDPLFGTTFSFDQEINTNGDGVVDDTILWYSANSHSATMGVFTLDEETILELQGLFFERAGGDFFEISIAQGAHTSFNTTDFFILRNGVFPGLMVAPTLLAVVPEPSTVVLFSLGALGLVAFGRRRRRP